MQAASACAKPGGITDVVGTTELSEKDATSIVYNTTAAISPHGELVAAYRKIHLYAAVGLRKSDSVSPGPLGPSLITVGETTVGIMTCYRLRFPELARLLADAGADSIALSAAWQI